jgi:uncharacterized RDD family membrane protein YckC
VSSSEVRSSLQATGFIHFRELELSDYGTPPPPPPPLSPIGDAFKAEYASAPSGGQLAHWGQRVAAYLLDYSLVLVFALLGDSFMPTVVATDPNVVPASPSLSGGNLPLAGLMYLIVLVIWGYNRWYKGGQGQSLGKKALGLVLLGESTGQPIGTGKAFLRDVCHILDGLACFVGYLFPLWDKKRQTFADKIMTTLVPKKA